MTGFFFASFDQEQTKLGEKMVDKHNPLWFNNCTRKSTILGFYHPSRKARHRWEGHRISVRSRSVSGTA